MAEKLAKRSRGGNRVVQKGRVSSWAAFFKKNGMIDDE
ncbi:hypothetical protein DB29_00852 [Shouchella clausii]|nr:hypothetical protein DB29_00852 [Shouchella clausii]